GSKSGLYSQRHPNLVFELMVVFQKSSFVIMNYVEIGNLADNSLCDRTEMDKISNVSINTRLSADTYDDPIKSISTILAKIHHIRDQHHQVPGYLPSTNYLPTDRLYARDRVGTLSHC
ncbi:hypothetical protein, partial [Pseudoalteromonas sp.]|uniref:hypothetical protein n=1 Tax=Pseudoalteromonas sp. TaxID=53249 RepID=UPI0026190E54